MPLGDIFGASLATVNGGNTRISKALIDAQGHSIPAVGEYLAKVNANLRENAGINAIDRKIAMRGLDAMAGGDLQQAKAANNKDLTQKMIDVGLNFNPASVAQTVWHGSPHKFDKFDMSKIGTGEGAQAYGHGLYFAESPQVSKDYAGALSAARSNKPVGNVDLQQVYQSLPNDVPDTLLAARRDFRALNESGELSAADRRDFLDAVKGNIMASRGGYLYKTDIPDEAVARFLDWDKPLSQQAPEVQQGIIKAGLVGPKHQFSTDDLLVGDFIKGLRPEDQALLNSQGGIPGIRYLDGGSRGTGAGTSNFVLFDDQMPRILEVNGQATGAQPWKPGEYQSAIASAFGGK